MYSTWRHDTNERELVREKYQFYRRRVPDEPQESLATL